jgi:hypothetical protein
VQEIQTLTINQVIIHQIPRVPKEGRQHDAPVLSDIPVIIDNQIRIYIRERIIGSINSEAFHIDYDPPAEPPENDDDEDGTPLPVRDPSPLPQLIVDFFVGEGANLVQASRTAAEHLYAQQGRTASAGMLAFVDGTIIAAGPGGQVGRVLVILKLEMSGALTIEPKVTDDGQHTFDVRLREVTLDKEAKVFKAAMFRRTTELTSLKGIASDHQRDRIDSTSEVANFFLRFLGCKLVETAERSTKHFLAKVQEFADGIEDEEERMEFWYQATNELKSNAPTVNIKGWAEEHLGADTADEFLATVKLPDGSIPIVVKDTRLINPVLDRTMYEFEGDVKVIGPNGALRESFKRDEQGNWVLTLSLKHMGPTRRR